MLNLINIFCLLREKMRDLFALVLAARVCLIYLLWGFKGAAPAVGLMLAADNH